MKVGEKFRMKKISANNTISRTHHQEYKERQVLFRKLEEIGYRPSVLLMHYISEPVSKKGYVVKEA